MCPLLFRMSVRRLELGNRARTQYDTHQCGMWASTWWVSPSCQMLFLIWNSVKSVLLLPVFIVLAPFPSTQSSFSFSFTFIFFLLFIFHDIWRSGDLLMQKKSCFVGIGSLQIFLLSLSFSLLLLHSLPIYLCPSLPPFPSVPHPLFPSPSFSVSLPLSPFLSVCTDKSHPLWEGVTPWKA